METRPAGRPETALRCRLTCHGAVQGVGFRPTVYRCAVSLGLAGFVRNERSSVVVEIQGDAARVRAFPAALAAALPAAARVDSVVIEEILPLDLQAGFRIEESLRTDFTLPPIPADLAICPDCTRELLDPADRRYLYPFITCTQCGPRYSITMDTPFDRATTTMAAFAQCPACEREYQDPESRRFHAQTNACSTCGPRLDLRDNAGRRRPGDPVIEAIRALASGETVALLGLGGFHLAADPRHAAAIARLRSDKQRERKPFALMVRDLDVARRLCVPRAEDERLLASPSSPIVIMPRREGAGDHLVAVSDTGTLGIMLPYTPLHLLVFRHPDVAVPYDHLVMTSGNPHDEPIIIDPEEGLGRLASLAGVFLVHDRRIAFRTDDTVVRALGDAEREGRRTRDAPSPAVCVFRRSRGIVPDPIRLARPVPEPTLAVGADMKAAPAIAVGADVVLGAHIGDLESVSAFEAFVEATADLVGRCAVRPSRIVHDLHPLYRSALWAKALPWGVKVPLQHHHAHILSVMAEHGIDESLGLAFDGTGYGTDGTIWGGEFLLASRSSCTRLGSFAPFPLPGGDAAVLHPARTAYALLRAGHPEEAERIPLGAEERALLQGMTDRSVSSPLTSSVGRIFDAAASALGLVQHTSYEGEGPIRLEGLAAGCSLTDGASGKSVSFDTLVPLVEGGAGFRLDASPLIAHLVRGAIGRDGGHAARLALLFHRAMARAALRGALKMRERTGIETLAVSGGVFQNALLRSILLPELRREGFRVVTNRLVPPGDGGIALGQAWYLGGFAGTA